MQLKGINLPSFFFYVFRSIFHHPWDAVEEQKISILSFFHERDSLNRAHASKKKNFLIFLRMNFYFYHKNFLDESKDKTQNVGDNLMDVKFRKITT